jgi:hypothetical protein
LGSELEFRFSLPTEHRSAEAAIRLSSEGEARSGDFRWEGEVLRLRPIPELEAGRRNVLAVEGEIRSADGRRFSVHKTLAFFSGNDAPALCLSAYLPPDAGIVGVGQALSFTFSAPVDVDSFKKSFSLSPSTEYDTAFSPDAQRVTISPRERWTNAAFYSWELRAGLRSVSGNQISAPRKGGFLVQADDAPPRILSIIPATFDGAVFLPLDGMPLSSLRNGDALYMRFNEDISLETLKAAIRIEPSLRGRVLRDSSACYAYVFDDSFAPGTEYRFVIGSELTDLSGNRMIEPRSERFFPSVPFQRVTRIRLTDGAGVKDATIFNTASSFAVALPDVEKKITFTIEFERPVEAVFRAQAQAAVQCLKLFPVGDSFDPTLQSAVWQSPTELALVYIGFKDSGTTTYHYRLRIAGGTGGIVNAEGARLKEDVWLIFHDE